MLDKFETGRFKADCFVQESSMYKYLDLKDKIIKEINKLKPHQKLPSRPALCMKYDISRATVDKVFKELMDEGLVYANKGSGTFVSQRDDYNLGHSKEKIKSWGVVVPNIMYDVCPGILRGIEDYAHPYDINIVICNTDNDAQKEHEYIVRLVNSGISGAIIIPAISATYDLMRYKYLLSKGIPFVFCNRGFDEIEDVPLVTSNDFYGGYIATKHLIEQGYRKIGYLSRIRYRTSMNRFFGYNAALLEAGIEIDRRIIATEIKNFRNSGISDTVSEMLSLENPPDSFFCHNDDLANSVYDVIVSRNLKISDDIGLIGYDNTNICEALGTKLTSVSFRNYEIGYKSADILFKLISGKQLEASNVFIFQPEIAVRDSCKGPLLKK